MKNNHIILIIGESTGLECLKALLKLKYFKISHIISADRKYDKIIHYICRINKFFFITSDKFKKNEKNIRFIKNKKYYLISIFSNIVINSSFLKKFKGRAYNFHPGLLPYYPGKNCVSGALYNNEKKSGVSMHIMTSKVDRGKILKKKIIKIKNTDNLMTLMLKLKLCCIELFKYFIRNLYFNKIFSKTKNDNSLKKKFPKFIPHGGKIDTNTDLNEFKKLFRASFFGPYKNTWGKPYFKFKNSTKKIISIEKIISKKISSSKFVEKISYKKYKLNFKRKTVIVNVN